MTPLSKTLSNFEWTELNCRCYVCGYYSDTESFHSPCNETFPICDMCTVDFDIIWPEDAPLTPIPFSELFDEHKPRS